MRSVFKEILIGAVLIFILSNIINYVRKPELNSIQLQKIEAQLVDGKHFSTEEGRPLVIHFWATWCPTCKLEASNIESISKKYEVLTIAVSSGKDDKIQAYLKERGLTFKVLNDVNGKWAEQFKVKAFPTTFIYDSQGKLKFMEVGYTTTAGLLARLKMAE
ncbi:MAG: thioredoxin [Epsilonproteobacteria bacterium (ex Lamellibrachia satsuma)]|nr:MAG: thioredoxin [Epsilonproteobacteria bacterium (ex Lamellibrachia satsuma)]